MIAIAFLFVRMLCDCFKYGGWKAEILVLRQSAQCASATRATTHRSDAKCKCATAALEVTPTPKHKERGEHWVP
jgi:hypothetical protein